jgi:hypothetical protein
MQFPPFVRPRRITRHFVARCSSRVEKSPKCETSTRVFALLTVQPAPLPPRRHGNLPSSPAPCAVLNSGAPAREASANTFVTFQAYEGVFVPLSRNLRRFYGVDPPVQALSTRFPHRVCPSPARIGPNLLARCEPTRVKPCFCALLRHEAHTDMRM